MVSSILVSFDLILLSKLEECFLLNFSFLISLKPSNKWIQYYMKWTNDSVTRDFMFQSLHILFFKMLVSWRIKHLPVS